MPIIIDNFHVETALPIDNRFVVGGADSFYQNKDDIQNKYLGLRIWDLNDDIPYCWKGTVEGWVSENSVGVSADSTSDVNYIPLFTTGPTVIGKSLLYQTIGNQIGIGILPTSLINPNTEVNGSSISFASSGLHVAGNIKTNNYFVGSGLYVTDINASNINNGLLSIARISHLQSNGSGLSSAQYVLSNIGLFNSVTWKLANTLSVANADISNKITITDDNSSPSFNYITFALGIGDQQLKISSAKMQFRPNTGQLFLSDGSPTDPVYSFLSNLSTGFYYNYSGNGNAVPSTIAGIGTSINGVEITRTNQNGLVVNNRIYISPTTDVLTNVGHGIVWILGGATNDTAINDGFNYLGGTNYNGVNSLTTQRLNFYGIGSHIPDNRNTGSSLAGRGTYIAGYFGVDTFSGGRLKVKVDELNDVTIYSKLNINLTSNFDTLFNSTNANLVLSTLTNKGGTDNFVAIKDWSVRSAQVPNTPAQDSWLTWKHHNGITIDGYYNTPNGPAKIITDPDSPAYGTLTFWERHPFLHEQYFGSENRKTLTINSSNPTAQNPFVKVDGNLLVGSSTTPINNSSGNIVVGSGNLLVGTNTIVPSAIVDFTSTTKGFLPPRMTTAQRNLITSPVSGLTIYNTDTGWTQANQSNTHRNALNTYDGSKWVGVTTFLYRGRTAIFNPGTDELIKIWLTTTGPVINGPLPTNAVQVSSQNYLVVGSLEVVGVNDTYDNYNRDNDVLFTIGRKFTESFELALRELGNSAQNLRFSFYLLPL